LFQKGSRGRTPFRHNAGLFTRTHEKSRRGVSEIKIEGHFLQGRENGKCNARTKNAPIVAGGEGGDAIRRLGEGNVAGKEEGEKNLRCPKKRKSDWARRAEC